MSKNTEQDAIDVIEKALDTPPGTVNLDTNAESLTEWDSLGHLSILTALDNLFEGKVAGIDGIGDADSVSKVLDALRQNSLV